MFNNDKQRKAMFASMLNGSNKFSKKLTSTQKQRLSDDLRYLKDQFDIGTISQKRYMDGINDLNEVKVNSEFAIAPSNLDSAKGYTGSEIFFENSGNMIPYVVTADMNASRPEDTIILAGEDFKSGIYQNRIPELRNIKLGEEQNKEFINEAASMERVVGRPVYSKKPLEVN